MAERKVVEVAVKGVKGESYVIDDVIDDIIFPNIKSNVKNNARVS